MIGALALWALWLLFGVQFVHGQLSSPKAASAPAAPASIAELGQVGDLFGGINALFAALAVVGVAWAGLQQQTTLRVTREALDEERVRFKAQQVDEDSRHNRQQSEATFFQMLGLLRDLLQSLDLHNYTAGPAGRGMAVSVDGAVEQILNLPGGMYGYNGGGVSETQALWANACNRAHHFVFAGNRSVLGPLFRTVYELFDHIEQVARTEPALADRFARVAKAQLTDPMLVLFALYACVDATKPYADTIHRFHLLEPLGDHKYIRPVFESLYHASAFDSTVPPQV
ncbi:MAG: hypothetical protein AD742_04000 [Methylibium sp. NZG]|nr:MAG: hypothetical protein AD742_04000 [Methylibium sp. NZG]